MQTPQVLSITGEQIITVKHPDLSDVVQTRASATIQASPLSVLDNLGFVDTNVILIGPIGTERAETATMNATPSRGTTLAIAATLAFAHVPDSPVYKLNEQQIRVRSASVDGGTLTTISTTPIQWARPFTTITIPFTSIAAYYVVEFYDGTNYEASDYLPKSGLGLNAAWRIIDNALKFANADDSKLAYEEFDYLMDGLGFAYDWIINSVDQSSIAKDWAWEIASGKLITTTVQEDTYSLTALSPLLKYPDTPQAFLEVIFNGIPLQPKDPTDMDVIKRYQIKTALTATATAGDTSITVTSTSEFPDDGTITFGSNNSVTYTAKTATTFTGIPASGDGSIGTTTASGASVWKTNFAGLPYAYTVIDGQLILDRPVLSDYAGQPLTLRYYGLTTKPVNTHDTIIAQDIRQVLVLYEAYHIQRKRGLIDDANNVLAQATKVLENVVNHYKSLAGKHTMVYRFGDTDLRQDIPFILPIR